MSAKDQEQFDKEKEILEENAGEPEEIYLDEKGEPIEPPENHEEDLEETRAEESEFQQRYLRLYAEYENFRKRSAREKSQERQRGRRDAAEKLMPVYDSLAMGLIKLPEDDPSREGLKAVERQLMASLEDLGIQKVGTIGEKFNPEFHEAIANMPSDEYEEGVVCEESRAGFQDELGLIRAAQVLVSSGPAG